MNNTAAATKASITEFLTDNGFGFSPADDAQIVLTGEWMSEWEGIVIDQRAEVEEIVDTPENRGVTDYTEVDPGDKLYRVSGGDSGEMRILVSAGSGPNGAVWEFAAE